MGGIRRPPVWDAARAELAACGEFDITLVNTSVDDVCSQLVALMAAQPAH